MRMQEDQKQNKTKQPSPWEEREQKPKVVRARKILTQVVAAKNLFFEREMKTKHAPCTVRKNEKVPSQFEA